MKLFSKIATVLAGFSLALGVGVAAMTRVEKNPTRVEAAAPADWEQCSSLSSFSAGDLIIIATNDGSHYFNGATKSGPHWDATTLSASSPASNDSAGVIELVTTGTANKYKLKIVGGANADKYVTATKAASKGSAISNSDDYGWTFALNATNYFTLTYGNSGAAAGFCSYSNSDFRSYASYSSGQYVTIYKYAASSASLSSIAISGTMTKTTYTTAEDWDPTGLTVTGTYSDSSTKNLTAGATFSYYNSENVEKATPKLFGECSNQTLKVVAHYPGVSDTAKYTASSAITITKAAEYELVTDATKLTKGTTLMIVGTGVLSSVTYTEAMVASRTTANGAFSSNTSVTLSDGFNGGSVATSANATIFTLDGAAGAWKIKNGDNQLGFTGTSNNNIQFNENQTDTFTISSVSGETYVTINSNNQSGRGLRFNIANNKGYFSNYGSGNNNPVYLFANIAEATFGTIDHISIATEPQTSFHSGSTYSASGMVVVAWDGADETTANSKVLNASDYSLKIDGAAITSDVTVFGDSDIGPHTITVTHTENAHDYTDTYSLYVYASATYEKVTTEPANWAGDYLIVADIPADGSKVEAGTYAMRSTGLNLDYVGNYAAVSPTTAGGKTTITTGQEFQFQIAAVTGGYSIKGQGNKYIGWGSSSNNGMSSSDTPLVNTISFDAGEVTILCSAGTKGLKLDKDSGQFRYYSNPGVQLYKLAESTEAADYAADFLEMLSTGAGHVCQADGNSDLEDLKVAWAILADDFQSLSSNAVRQQFTQGTADESGDDIAKALALYDFIATKYGTRLESDDCDNYNFMGRTITPISSIHNIFGQNTNGNNILLIVVISSITVASAIGLFFIIRRRKHN